MSNRQQAKGNWQIILAIVIWVIMVMLTMNSCHRRPATGNRQHAKDTVIISKTVPVVVHDTIWMHEASKTDSLQTVLFLANYKIERVRYYVKICQRRPSQQKFLLGWIIRAISDK